MNQSLNFTKKIWHILKSQSFETISQNPYATHIPIFAGISRIYNINKVIEFGSGPNSTHAFMNRNLFPSVQHIVSYENDLQWYKKIQLETEHDHRMNLNYTEGKISESVMNEDIQSYDLVFIDDSLSSKDRAGTIRAVLAKKPRVLIIHDFENYPYRLAMFRQKTTYRFKALLPNTGVYAENLDLHKIKKINDVINNNKMSLKPDDIKGWIDIFSKTEF